MTDRYATLSSFQYAANDPIANVDVMGLSVLQSITVTAKAVHRMSSFSRVTSKILGAASLAGKAGSVASIAIHGAQIAGSVINGLEITRAVGLSPIFGRNGIVLGTDNRGMQGAPIIMDKKYFKQGMRHSEALSYNLGFTGLNGSSSLNRFMSSFARVLTRPDRDGIVTMSEGISWAKAHPGALKHPTTWNRLYIDASKLDFGDLSTSYFTHDENVPTPVNLLDLENFSGSLLNTELRSTVYALGRVYMKLLDRSKGTVKIVNGNEATDYDWNKGGNFFRRNLINFERWRTGIGDGRGFKTFYYGIGTLNKVSPSLKWATLMHTLK